MEIDSSVFILYHFSIVRLSHRRAVVGVGCLLSWSRQARLPLLSTSATTCIRAPSFAGAQFAVVCMRRFERSEEATVIDYHWIREHGSIPE